MHAMSLMAFALTLKRHKSGTRIKARHTQTNTEFLSDYVRSAVCETEESIRQKRTLSHTVAVACMIYVIVEELSLCRKLLHINIIVPVRKYIHTYMYIRAEWKGAQHKLWQARDLFQCRACRSRIVTVRVWNGIELNYDGHQKSRHKCLRVVGCNALHSLSLMFSIIYGVVFLFCGSMLWVFVVKGFSFMLCNGCYRIKSYTRSDIFFNFVFFAVI